MAEFEYEVGENLSEDSLEATMCLLLADAIDDHQRRHRFIGELRGLAPKVFVNWVGDSTPPVDDAGGVDPGGETWWDDCMALSLRYEMPRPTVIECLMQLLMTMVANKVARGMMGAFVLRAGQPESN